MSVGAFFKKTLPHMALAVASGVPGPVGMVAGIINQFVPQPDGKPLPAQPDPINHAVEGATADQLLQLKQADQDFAEKMKQLGIQEEADWLSFVQQDLSDARDREEKVRDNTPKILAYMTVGTGLAMSVFLVSPWFHGAQVAAVAGFAGTVLGYVISEAKQVMAYYFGSSSGSVAKNEMLADALQNGNGK